MIEFGGRGILLDIEGTTSSISFVYDVMFPFVRRELDQFLREKWGDPQVVAACEAMARDAGRSSLADWQRSSGAEGESAGREWVARETTRLMDEDVKATGLKQLQGLIWESGFASGELKAQVYDDVPPALKHWKASGIGVRIYSSGSIQAQKLFFGHTVAGNLLPLLSGHYDTTTGPKKNSASYTAIAKEFGLPPQHILFLSDVVAELDAAAGAGLKTGLVLRPGNPEQPAHGHPVLRRFDEIDVMSRL